MNSLRESASYDPEKLPPPKELFALNRSKELDEWFAEREQLAKQPKPLDA